MSERAPAPRAASEKAPLWKRLLPIVGGIAIVVVLFGWVLPQFIDYDAVFRAIGNIDAGEWLVLVVLALVRFLPEGWIYMAAQPGLSAAQATKLFLVSETLGNVPPGGLDLVSRYQMARSWGYPASSSTSATIASWVFTALSKLVLPIVAVLFLAIKRIRQDDVDALAVIALAVVVGGTVVLALVFRSENLAGRIGDVLGRGVRRVAGIFRKEVQTDFRDLVLEFREQASEVLRKRTPLGLASGLAARILSFSILLLTARFVGLGADQLDWTVAFATFAAVNALTVIPIFSAPGLSEALYIAAFNAAAGGGAADQVAAVVFVFRILTWLLPIPFGGIAFTRWRDDVRAAGQEELLDAFDDPEAQES